MTVLANISQMKNNSCTQEYTGYIWRHLCEQCHHKNSESAFLCTLVNTEAPVFQHLHWPSQLTVQFTRIYQSSCCWSLMRWTHKWNAQVIYSSSVHKTDPRRCQHHAQDPRVPSSMDSLVSVRLYGCRWVQVTTAYGRLPCLVPTSLSSIKRKFVFLQIKDDQETPLQQHIGTDPLALTICQFLHTRWWFIHHCSVNQELIASSCHTHFCLFFVNCVVSLHWKWSALSALHTYPWRH